MQGIIQSIIWKKWVGGNHIFFRAGIWKTATEATRDEVSELIDRLENKTSQVQTAHSLSWRVLRKFQIIVDFVTNTYNLLLKLVFLPDQIKAKGLNYFNLADDIQFHSRSKQFYSGSITSVIPHSMCKSQDYQPGESRVILTCSF